MESLKYKNLNVSYETSDFVEMLGTYTLSISKDDFLSVTCEEDESDNIENGYIEIEKEKVHIRINADVQIELLNLLLDKKHEVDIEISDISNIYWFLHDILHSEKDILYIKNRERIPDYIEVERLKEALDLLEEYDEELSYEEISKIIEVSKEIRDTESFNTLVKAYEKYLKEEIFI